MATFASVPCLALMLSSAVASCALAVLAFRLRRRAQARLARLAGLERDNRALQEQVEALRAAAHDRDRAEAASEAKSRFLATVSHEIRTPLSGILGLAGLLADAGLSREQQSYVAAIRTSGQALITLLEEILDFARIEAGRLELAPEPFDVRELVEGVVELLAPRAQGKGLEIASFVSADVPARLIGDANRLRQALLNLGGNAVKFTEAGGVGVAVARHLDRTILFSVADTGPGVPADRREAVFQEFEQADGSFTRRHGGVGLGLAITKRIVALMGGELVLEPRGGGGSSFAFSVPLAADIADPQEAAAPGQAEIRRALVVSAELFQPAYLSAMLAEHGIEAVRVRSFSEAAALIRAPNSNFDGLFVDCGRGEDEARAVAAMGRLSGMRKTVLLVSPFQRRALGEPLMGSFDAWLVKPIRRVSLVERIAEFAPRRRLVVPFPSWQNPTDRPARVLLAEDNPINAMIARSILERAGAQIVQAENGQTAIAAVEAALAEQRPFDLILMDVCMPVIDGLEATRRIRIAENRQGARPATIVATTARTLRQTEQECAAAGMDSVLTKPIDPTALQVLVTQGVRLATAS